MTKQMIRRSRLGQPSQAFIPQTRPFGTTLLAYFAGFAAAVFVLGGEVQKANAVPILQLYLEEASYDQYDRTWVLELPQLSNPTFRLWAIGNTERSPITNVRLSVAYPAFLRTPAEDLVFSFLPSTTGGYGGFTDPSVPPAPVFLGIGGPNTQPLIAGTMKLPSHGVFGAGTVWQEFHLGDFTLTDSPIADFSETFPAPGNTRGQINVYEVRIGYPRPLPEGTTIHFDLYGVVAGRGVFAPVSHDAEVRRVPEPASAALLLMLVGASGVAWRVRKRRRS